MEDISICDVPTYEASVCTYDSTSVEELFLRPKVADHSNSLDEGQQGGGIHRTVCL